MNINLRQKLIIFDVDGTLTQEANPYLYLALQLDCKSQMLSLVNQYLESRLPYHKLVAAEAKLFMQAYKKQFGKNARIPKGFLESKLPLPKFRPGAKKLYNLAKSQAFSICFLSSGFAHIVHQVARKLGEQKMRNAYCNDFVYQNNFFSRIKIDVKANKIHMLKRIVHEKGVSIKDVVYFGDSEFDNRIIFYLLNKGGSAVFINDLTTTAKIVDSWSNGSFLAVKSLGSLHRHLS